MSKRDSYESNLISRQLEGPVAWWRKVTNGLPLLFAPIAFLFALLWGWLMVDTVFELIVLTEGQPLDDVVANRNRTQSIFFGVGIIGALLAAIIVPVRLWLQNRQTVTAEQGLITDRLTKAIEQLGAEKTIKRHYLNEDGNPHLDNHNVPIMQEETVPNLEVRLGAIYALERIAQDSERDHITVMETLSAYIRENASGHSPTQKSPVAVCRVDIHASLDVISRRSKESKTREASVGFRLDLRGADFGYRDLQNVNLEGAVFGNALFTGANLCYSYFCHANFDGADFTGAVTLLTKFDNAYFHNSPLTEDQKLSASVENIRMDVTTKVRPASSASG